MTGFQRKVFDSCFCFSASHLIPSASCGLCRLKRPITQSGPSTNCCREERGTRNGSVCSYRCERRAQSDDPIRIPCLAQIGNRGLPLSEPRVSSADSLLAVLLQSAGYAEVTPHTEQA